ncbi:hypothetical protein ACJX0J_042271, partial [Zea mays]
MVGTKLIMHTLSVDVKKEYIKNNSNMFILLVVDIAQTDQQVWGPHSSECDKQKKFLTLSLSSTNTQIYNVLHNIPGIAIDDVEQDDAHHKANEYTTFYFCCHVCLVYSNNRLPLLIFRNQFNVNPIGTTIVHRFLANYPYHLQ